MDWFDIKGFEGLYKINKKGEIFSYNRIYTYIRKGEIIERKQKGKLLKISPNKDTGYLSLCLSKNGIKFPFTLHRLMALNFIANPENKPYVIHINKDILDNSLDNLKWDINISASGEAFKKFQKKGNNARKKKVIQCDLVGNEIYEFNSMQEAQLFTGICAASISNCCTKTPHKIKQNGKIYTFVTKQAGGFKWRYK